MCYALKVPSLKGLLNDWGIRSSLIPRLSPCAIKYMITEIVAQGGEPGYKAA